MGTISTPRNTVTMSSQALQIDGADLRHLQQAMLGLRCRVSTRLAKSENVSRQVIAVPHTLSAALEGAFLIMQEAA